MSPTVLSSNAALLSILVFGVAMNVIVIWRKRSEQHRDGFLVADRNVSTFRGALSIAVSWIWAPAIFVCSMQSFTLGVPGIFWFTAPNVLCFFLFAAVAVRVRRAMPAGYTFLEYLDQRFGSHRGVHLVYLSVFFGYQLAAATINPLAAGYFLHALSGIDARLTVTLTTLAALSYSLFGGLKASIATDVIQMGLVLLLGAILVPLVFVSVDDATILWSGLGGSSGEYRSLWNSHVALTMGIPMTISLLAGPLSDQMFFQRVFAVRKENVAKTFVLGGLLFALVPVTLSLLGFIGAGLVQRGLITVANPEMVGPMVIAYTLPHFALYAFCFMALAGLCSTMDSAYCAASSLGAVDLYRRYLNPLASDAQMLRASRIVMLVIALGGWALAMLQPKLFWIFFIQGTLVAAALVPTLLAIYWKRTTAKGAAFGVVSSVVLSLPLSIYANIVEDAMLNVIAALASVAVGSLVCVVLSARPFGSREIEERGANHEIGSDGEPLRMRRVAG
ncbi:MAG: hypothetical protein IT290_12850, partial [Deltaproteobacteria bacterium]|nr:hypothetical protein [Deltaproteobacteria bacterium]